MEPRLNPAPPRTPPSATRGRRRFEAILLDLDGTLIDSAPDLRTHLNAALADWGRPGVTTAAVRRMIGDGARILVDRAFRATGPALPQDELDRAVARFVELEETDVLNETTVLPGVVEGLERLSAEGRGLALCTNKPIRVTRRLLDTLGLQRWIPHVVGGDSLPTRKPAPEMLYYALSLLTRPRERALMVGDSINDLDAGRNAGVPVVLLEGGYSERPVSELGADAVLPSFTGLPDWIAAADG